VIVYGWKENRVSKVEKYLHALPIAAGFGTGIAALAMKLYNGAGWICWIAPAPNNPERDNPNFGIFRLAFLYVDAWVIIVFLAICMGIIYFHVLKQEKSLDKYNANFAQKKRKQSKKIRNQAFLYVGCMYITWIFGSVRTFWDYDAFHIDSDFSLVIYRRNDSHALSLSPPAVRYFVSCNLRGKHPQLVSLYYSSLSSLSKDSLI
jgi:hypothetical protein